MQEKNIRTAKYVLIAFVLISMLLFVFELNSGDITKIAREKTLDKVDYFKDFSLSTLDGGTFSSQDAKEYKLVIYNGWGPWCTACVGEMPQLEKLSGELKENGIFLVGVVADYYVNQSPERDYNSEVRQAVSQLNISFPILLSDGKFYEEVCPTMKSIFPSTWITDDEGNIVGFISGARTEDGWVEAINESLEKIGEEHIS